MEAWARGWSEGVKLFLSGLLRAWDKEILIKILRNERLEEIYVDLLRGPNVSLQAQAKCGERHVCL